MSNFALRTAPDMRMSSRSLAVDVRRNLVILVFFLVLAVLPAKTDASCA